MTISYNYLGYILNLLDKWITKSFYLEDLYLTYVSPHFLSSRTLESPLSTTVRPDPTIVTEISYFPFKFWEKFVCLLFGHPKTSFNVSLPFSHVIYHWLKLRTNMRSPIFLLFSLYSGTTRQTPLMFIQPRRLFWLESMSPRSRETLFYRLICTLFVHVNLPSW